MEVIILGIVCKKKSDLYLIMLLLVSVVSQMKKVIM